MPKRKRCGCKGRSGEPKGVYHSRQAAVTRAIRTGRFARTYPCPKLKGKWHITHA